MSDRVDRLDSRDYDVDQGARTAIDVFLDDPRRSRGVDATRLFRSLDDLCFNVEETETRHLRLWLGNSTDPEELWLGIARVGFKCGNAPTAAPTTAVPTTALPTPVPTTDECRPDKFLGATCHDDSGHFLEGDAKFGETWGCAQTLDGAVA